MLDNDEPTTGPEDPQNSPENNPENNPEDRGADTPAPTTAPETAPDTPEPEAGSRPVKKAAKKTAKAPAKKAAKAPAKKAAAKKTTAKKAAAKAADAPADDAASPQSPASESAPESAPESSEASTEASAQEPAAKPARKTTARKRAAAKPAPETTEQTPAQTPEAGPEASADEPAAAPAVLFQAPEKPAPRKRTTRKVAAAPVGGTEATASSEAASSQAGATSSESAPDSDEGTESAESAEGKKKQGGGKKKSGKKSGQKDKKDSKDAQDAKEKDSKGKKPKAEKPKAGKPEGEESEDTDSGSHPDAATSDQAVEDTTSEGEQSGGSDDESGEGGARRRRRRGGRRRRKPAGNASADGDAEDSADSADSGEGDDAQDRDEDGEEGVGGSRRRRRRRRSGDDGSGGSDGSGNARARKPRNPEDEITSIGGSTRLEAKKQRRREGREAGRRRAPIVSEAEFLARRESVDRVMVIRQRDDLTQIGVLEDKVLVEHYVARESQTSLIGNVYLGRVQNVLPSMEAAFIDIGKGRNAVLYAGEVNWKAVGHKDGQPRKIESVLSSGQTILVQVSKDPVGHKGARLTGQVSLPGRFLVYVPDGNTSGISRKLPDTERNRLKTLLKEIVPDSAGVIVRTAAEGASEEELTRDVERLTARWNDIEQKVKDGKGPQLLYGEPDLTLKVVRDLFTEDFTKLVVQGDDAWELVENYVSHVAPDLADRLERFEGGEDGAGDVFSEYRLDEQIAKGLDRKVWLPSGGSLIIDRTEAMTVVDVNTGKFTGSGGNLEETVTKNNLEAAEEIVRQLRLRDIGGIIVVDFIDMVLESNRDLVLRRLVECLGRDRTRHQVAEVTSLGLVQMTRKRIGTGLLEAFSTDCEACKGRGLILHDHPVEPNGRSEDDDSRGRRGRGGGRNRGGRGGGNGGGNGGNGSSGGSNGGGNGGNAAPAKPSPADLAKSRPPERATNGDAAGESTPASESPSPAEVAAKASAPAAEDQPAAEESRGAEESQAVEGSDQTVIGKPAAIAPEPQHVPSEATAGQPEEPAQEPAQEQDQAQDQAGTPRVVTSTRRRTARRPAGPPAAQGSEGPTGISALSEAAPRSGAGRQSAPSAEPLEVPVEPAVPGHTPQADPRATESEPDAQDQPWPADSAAGSEPGAGSESPGSPDGDQDSEEESSAGSVLHVPVKRKGSRKR